MHSTANTRIPRTPIPNGLTGTRKVENGLGIRSPSRAYLERLISSWSTPVTPYTTPDSASWLALLGLPAVTNSKDTIYIFHIGADYALYRKVWDGVQYTPDQGYDRIGGTFIHTPAAVSAGAGEGVCLCCWTHGWPSPPLPLEVEFRVGPRCRTTGLLGWNSQRGFTPGRLLGRFWCGPI